MGESSVLCFQKRFLRSLVQSIYLFQVMVMKENVAPPWTHNTDQT